MLQRLVATRLVAEIWSGEEALTAAFALGKMALEDGREENRDREVEEKDVWVKGVHVPSPKM